MAQTLFEQYGGFAQVSRIVSEFYGKVTRSEKIGHYFEGYDMRRLIDHQTKFVASVMGGPASFTNEKLASAHANMNIDGESFDEVLRLLTETFEDFGVDNGDIGIIIGEIQSRRPHIVSA